MNENKILRCSKCGAEFRDDIEVGHGEVQHITNAYHQLKGGYDFKKAFNDGWDYMERLETETPGT